MKTQDIESLVEQYKKLTKGVIDYKKYAYYALTHHSTSIEGSTLTESQVVDLLEYGKTATNKPFEHHQMVYDHFQALVWLMDEASRKTPISPSFIRQLGAKVMYSTGSFVNTIIGNFDVSKGEYRLCSVMAGNRTFPDYKKVPDLVQRLCSQHNPQFIAANTFKAEIELAFQLHFDFVSIHPFGDGNGRTSRLLMNYIQAYFDLPLSVIFKQDRIAYINALETARNPENIQPYFDFMWAQYVKFLRKEIKYLSTL